MRKSLNMNFQTDEIVNQGSPETGGVEINHSFTDGRRRSDIADNFNNNRYGGANQKNQFIFGNSKEDINIKYEILNQFLKNQANKKKNISISTDNISNEVINKRIKSNSKFIKPQSDIKDSSSLLKEMVELNKINQDLANEIIDELVIFPDNKQSNNILHFNKSFLRLYNLNKEEKDISKMIIMFESAIKTNRYITPNQRQFAIEESKDTTMDFLSKNDKSKMLSANNSELNISKISKISKSKTNDMNTINDIIETKLPKDKNSIIIANKYIIAFDKDSSNNKQEISFDEERSHTDNQAVIKRKEKQRNSKGNNQIPLPSNEKNESDTSFQAKTNNSEKSLVSVEDEDDDDLISDDILEKYKQQEQIIKEMAEDSVKKEQHLKQIVNSIQTLLNTSTSNKTF